MQITTVAGIAALALVAAAVSPSCAATIHHRIHHGMAEQSHQSTPAERQETADLNRQQLARAEANVGGGDMATGANVSATNPGTATQQNGLATEPANYQRTEPTGAGTSGNAAGIPSIGSQPGMDNSTQHDPNSAAPPGAGSENNPSGTTTPPPANPSGGTQ